MWTILVLGLLVGAAMTAGPGYEIVYGESANSYRVHSTDPAYIVALAQSNAVVASPRGSRVVQMTAKNGVRYSCTIPDPKAEERTIVARPGDEDREHSLQKAKKNLMRRMRKALAFGCFTKLVGYWTYEVCPFRKVSQYHKEGQSKSPQFELGKYDGEQDYFSSMLEYSQVYLDGSGGRRATVVFTCRQPTDGKTVEHELKDVREPTTNNYYFEIETSAACLPVGSEQLAEDVVSPEALLKPLERQCYSLSESWWTYKLCFMTGVTQYHKETFYDDKTRALTEEYTLGSNDGTEFQLGKHDGRLYRGFQLHLRTPTSEPYLSQNYTSGTVCDVGSQEQRKTEVRYFCSPDSEATVVKSIQEASTCSYVMQISTRLLCDHESFQDPGETQVKEIVCEAVAKSTLSS